ncbi:hypothetical protein J2TS4_45410 [Paenibacillus sp. J2TS4]|nr:hypothetical protein J2TS4_45410 [Paenibacillus sp. J2TS4]
MLMPPQFVDEVAKDFMAIFMLHCIHWCNNYGGLRADLAKVLHNMYNNRK